MTDSAMPEPIFITRSIVPDVPQYNEYVERIFATRHMTNNGACVRRLEKELTAHLKLSYLALCANGTLALQLAVHAAGIAGKKS